MKTHDQSGFLLLVKEDEDAERIDSAIASKALGFVKLGSRTYLLFPEGGLQWFHDQMKKHQGIVGELYWFPLQAAWVTN